MAVTRIEPDALHPIFDAITVADLRRRHTEKWAGVAADVLPAWVAEMDYPLAPVVLDAVHDVLDRHDLGYPHPVEFRTAFAGWAKRAQGWTVDPELTAVVADVMSGLELAIRELTEPGDPIVLCLPVYPPFFELLRELRRPLAACALRDTGDGWALDLDAIGDALAAGAKAVLLCHPHNPVGRVWRPDELHALADLVDRHGAHVISDEVHAPILAAGQHFVPYAATGPVAAAHSVTVTSVSKAWNVPGLKSAILVAQPETAHVVHRQPVYESFRPSTPGVAVATALWTDDGGWLAATNRYLDDTRAILRDWVDSRPDVRWHGNEAGYLAWLDLRGSTLGDDPAAVLLDRARVRVSPGADFAPDTGLGTGFVRFNHATSTPILRQLLARLDAALSR